MWQPRWRLRPRFSLRQLMVVVLVLGTLMGIVAARVRDHQRIVLETQLARQEVSVQLAAATYENARLQSEVAAIALQSEVAAIAGSGYRAEPRGDAQSLNRLGLEWQQAQAAVLSARATLSREQVIRDQLRAQRAQLR